MLDDGKSERIAAEFFNVGKGTINRIKSNCVAIQLYMDEDIETAVIEFLKLARDRGMAVTGPMLRTLAEKEANANRVEGFKASEATTTKSLVLPKDTAHGIKQDKSRLTLIVCTSMLSEKEKILLMWKSEKPRALKGADMSKLPVVHKA
ncbi:Tigger transposable element-derived protein 6-like [Oopsacas minuta]|uniref:Tigger transposable element-derived protein 6-like n=1 Tax=Oopsacas minuta TaxID=111878 RepID=A0AAV7JJB0_9METZ|nr:Tigger transposable element-derived protein 6-like [Oopsacas minuta]